MGKMKELAMQLREQEMQEPIPGVDYPIQDPEDQYWEERARQHDEFMMDLQMSGMPSHLADVYGIPNRVIIDELPWSCQVCSDPVATGNEYCGQECREIYHERKRNEEEELPF